jgi:hypothetical protein
LASDRLYLLRPDFLHDGKGPYFCPETALIEGLLSFYPRLRTLVDVHYIGFDHPRREVAHELGPEIRRAPILVMDEPPAHIPEGVKLGSANGRHYVWDEVEICRYLAAVHGVSAPHP